MINSASVLAVVVLKRNIALPIVSLFKKTLSLWLGVFFSVSVLAETCSVSVQGLAAFQVASVVDGDTLRLSNGDKLRVIGINSPEIDHGSEGDSQPLATAAKLAVNAFLATQHTIYIRNGVESRDRYQRRLAHVYRADGSSLAQVLLSQGLAWHIVVPPNNRFAECYHHQQLEAQRHRLGIWGLAAYQPKSAASLSSEEVGFQRVTGIITQVDRVGHKWWLEMGRLAIAVDDKDLVYFNAFNGRDWLGKSITISGWLIDRSHQTNVKNKAYPPFLMHWRHPLMALEH